MADETTRRDQTWSGRRPTATRIEPVDLQFEMQRSYMDYAMSVIVCRALPDVRDGLKPVHRRVIYAMYDGGYRPDRGVQQVRSHRRRRDGQLPPARRLGDLRHLGSAGAAVVACATHWLTGRETSGRRATIRRPPCATPSAGCSRLPWRWFARSTKRPSTSSPNYDGKTQEPVILPARFPNLLVNGSAGIAVGMATNIPPHNLREVADGGPVVPGPSGGAPRRNFLRH